MFFLSRSHVLPRIRFDGCISTEKLFLPPPPTYCQSTTSLLNSHLLGLGRTFFWRFCHLDEKYSEQYDALNANIISTTYMSLKPNLPEVGHKNPGHISNYILPTYPHLCRWNYIQSSLVKEGQGNNTYTMRMAWAVHIWPREASVPPQGLKLNEK